MAAELAVSVVIYRSDLAALEQTLTTLRAALSRACDTSRLERAAVTLVDNGSTDEAAADAVLARALAPSVAWLCTTVLRGHGNVGYGAGHDLAIAASRGTYHLVLNPDVLLAPDAVEQALVYLDSHPDVGLLAPHVVGPSGEREFLCKRYPSVLALGLRGFAPRWARRPFRRLLHRYEMRDLPEDRAVTGVPIASGAFMFVRRSVLEAVGGFSPDYFLYFEDFDLSLRIGRLAQIAWVPAVRIRHAGGRAAAKGWAHRRLFFKSAATFFRQHGWKLV